MLSSLLTGVLGSMLWGAPAATVSPGEAVTFDQALALAADTIEVRTLRRELEIRVAQDARVGSGAGPVQLTVMPGLTLGSKTPTTFELQSSLTQDWSLAGLGQRQKASVRAEHEQLRAQARARALRSRLHAAKHWVDLHTHEATTQLIQQQLVAEKQRAIHVEHAVQAGVFALDRLDDQQVVVAELEQSQREADSRRIEAAKRLAVAMGRSPSRLLRTQGSLPRPELPPSSRLVEIRRHLDKLPQVLVQQLNVDTIRANELERHASESLFGQLGAQVERAGPKSWTVFGIAGVSLPGFGQRARAGSRGRAQIAKAQGAVDAARIELSLEVELLLHEVDHSREALVHLEQVLLPRLKSADNRSRALVDAGEVPGYYGYQAQRRYFAAQTQRLQLRGQALWAKLRLWLLLASLAEQGINL